MTTTEGIYIDDKLLMGGDTTGPLSAQMLLSNRDIDIAVLESKVVSFVQALYD